MDEKQDFVAAMASIWTEPTHDQLLRAATQFLLSGSSLHKTKVGGEMLTRAEVATGLERYLPGPKGFYREMIEENDTRR